METAVVHYRDDETMYVEAKAKHQKYLFFATSSRKVFVTTVSDIDASFVEMNEAKRSISLIVLDR